MMSAFFGWTPGFFWIATSFGSPRRYFRYLRLSTGSASAEENELHPTNLKSVTIGSTSNGVRSSSQAFITSSVGAVDVHVVFYFVRRQRLAMKHQLLNQADHRRGRDSGDHRVRLRAGDANQQPRSFRWRIDNEVARWQHFFTVHVEAYARQRALPCDRD